VRDEVIVAPFNDLAAAEALIHTHHDELACVIVEPLQRIIPPAPGFLEGLRRITAQYGIILIFDEVVTGFRFAYGGAQEYYGVTPDLCTLGKVIGGGLPVGAYGGRADIMAMVAPAGPMYQAGTLSGNPLAMTAGIKTLELLKQPGTYERLEAITQRLAMGILDAARGAGLPITGGSISAMFGFFLCEGPVRNFEDAKAADTVRFGKLHRAMLERGVYLAPSAFEAGFTSLAHSDDDIDATLEAFRESFAAVA
jgi:glutamate-1-semialdehyde 2,1-aminomutase